MFTKIAIKFSTTCLTVFYFQEKKAKINNRFISVQSSSTQTEHILPYEHLFYSVFPAHNDTHNSRFKFYIN